ncbi:major facilitator super [Blomia tropicalis]|nr:major facilitator super [Blomia tropicalis]
MGNLKSRLNEIDPYNLIYSIILLFNNFVHGYNATIIGTTLVDLSFVYNVTLNTISYISMIIYFGFLIGSLVALTYKRWLNRQLTVICANILSMVVMTCVPFYSTIGIAFFAMVLNGFGMGVWVGSCNSWLVEMWPTGNAIILQLNYVMYGIGTIIAPSISAPFIYGKAEVDQWNQTITIPVRIQSLAVPFGFNGIVQLIAPVVLSILYVKNRYQYVVNKNDETESNSNEQQQKTKRQNKIAWRKTKLLISGLALAIVVAAKIGYVTYSSAMFQYMEIKLSASQSAHVMTTFTALYTIGPLITAFVSIKLRPDHILSYHYVLIIGSLVLIYLGQNQIILIYLGSGILGFSISVMWPAMIAFTEYLELTFIIISLMLFVIIRTWIGCTNLV